MPVNLNLLWRRKAVLGFCAIVGVAIGAAYLQLVPPTYEAQARVLIEPRRVTPEAAPLGRVDPEFLPTQAETIGSPLIVERALETISITPPPLADTDKFDAVRHVVNSLNVTPVLKANVLTVGYRSIDSDEALKVISKVLDAYRSHVSELDRGDSESSIHVVAARERSLREDLEDAQKQYKELRRTSPVLGQGREASAQALTELNQLRNQLIDVRRRYTELKTRLASVNGVAPDRDPSARLAERSRKDSTQSVRVVAMKSTLEGPTASDVKEVLRSAEPADARVIEDLEERLRFARLRTARLDEVYGPRHPEMSAARAQVAEYEAQLAERIQGIVQAWRRQLELAEATEKELTKSLTAEQKEVKSAEIYFVEEEQLKGNLDRIDELHSATLGQLVAMQTAEDAIAEGRRSVEVRVLDGPVLLDDRVWPKPKLMLGSSACLGLMAGIGMVWLRESQKRAADVASERPDGDNGTRSPRHDDDQYRLPSLPHEHDAGGTA